MRSISWSSDRTITSWRRAALPPPMANVDTLAGYTTRSRRASRSHGTALPLVRPCPQGRDRNPSCWSTKSTTKSPARTCGSTRRPWPPWRILQRGFTSLPGNAHEHRLAAGMTANGATQLMVDLPDRRDVDVEAPGGGVRGRAITDSTNRLVYVSEPLGSYVKSSGLFSAHLASSSPTNAISIFWSLFTNSPRPRTIFRSASIGRAQATCRILAIAAYWCLESAKASIFRVSAS